MEPKVLFMLVDGVAEVGLAELGGKTYLQHARLPTLDTLAASGLTGLIDPVETGYACGSDTAHMSLFDYDPFRNYRGRGSFESIGSGLDMEFGEIAFKCNFAHVDPDTNIVTTRRVCRQFHTWGLGLIEALDSITIPGFENYQVFVKHATEHRAGLKIRGPGLSSWITGTDPIKDNRKLERVVAEDLNDPEAVMTAALVNALSDKISEILKVHPINLERQAQGLIPANVLLVRGCGVRLNVPSFSEKHKLRGFMIAPTAIIRGFGITIGLDIIDVPGTTGDEHSDHEAKYLKAVEMFDSGYEFGFVHIKAVDDMAHDKNTERRIQLIEKIDGIIGRHLVTLTEKQHQFVLVFTGDHTTTVISGEHTFEPVPFVISSIQAYAQTVKGEPVSSQLQDEVTQFDELSCAKGSLGRFPGHRIFSVIEAFKAKLTH